MNTATFQDFLRRLPFQPIEVRMSNGDVHQIRHPENAFLLRSSVILGNPTSDNFEFLSLLHIVNVKAVPMGSQQTNGDSQNE